MLERRLQIFVSSTYEDLKEERQAAVEAILSAGHIPAGMELFAAGDASQLEVIRDWIKGSDAFLLILGGRYGTIESVSGKSYIQLEWEYARSLEIPSFALIMSDDAMDEKVRRNGLEVIERENEILYREFREQLLSHLVQFWNGKKEIQLAILRKLGELAQRRDLIGWVRADMAVEANPLVNRVEGLIKGHVPRWQVVRELEAAILKFHTKKWALQTSEQSSEAKNKLTYLELRHVLDDEPSWSYVEDTNAQRRAFSWAPIHITYEGMRYWQIRQFPVRDGATFRQYLASPAFHELLVWFRKVDRAIIESLVIEDDLGDWWRQVLPLGWGCRLTYFSKYFQGPKDIQSMTRVIAKTINVLDRNGHEVALSRCAAFSPEDRELLKDLDKEGRRAAAILPTNKLDAGPDE